MKADEASKMIPVMDEDLVIEVMAKLKPKQAASILGKLDAELAAKLTTRMAEAKAVK
jgi:flagellar motility protein MotE (MotC chaperone)